jgi:hypothetical protein
MISRTGLCVALGEMIIKLMAEKMIPKMPNAPNTIFSTPKTVTELGRCMIGFQMVALPLADKRKM